MTRTLMKTDEPMAVQAHRHFGTMDGLSVMVSPRMGFAGLLSRRCS
jgi:hypothetical protein